MINRGALWREVRLENPLVHTLSNQVSANDCANLLLAVGASPIMASAVQEMDAITRVSQVSVLNLGTPSVEKYEACKLAGVRANELGHPVIVDPVGVGVSDFRMRAVRDLLEEVRPSIIRANVSEVQSLLGRTELTRGVDSLDVDRILDFRKDAEALARELDCVVLMTGASDLVTDGCRTFMVDGGSSLLKQITGTGDMLSVLCGALSHVTDAFWAAVHASYSWKVIGEHVQLHATGLGHAHQLLFDYAGQIEVLLSSAHHVTLENLGANDDEN